MDWNLSANVAVVVVPAMTFVGVFLDQRIKLAIRENNEEFLKRMNGAYVKKEVCDAKCDASHCYFRMAAAARDK